MIIIFKDTNGGQKMKQIKIEIENRSSKTINQYEDEDKDKELKQEKGCLEIKTTQKDNSRIYVEIESYMPDGMTHKIFVMINDHRAKTQNFGRVATLKDLTDIGTESKTPMEYFDENRAEIIKLYFPTLRKANMFIVDMVEKVSELKKQFQKQEKDRQEHMLNGDFEI